MRGSHSLATSAVLPCNPCQSPLVEKDWQESPALECRATGKRAGGASTEPVSRDSTANGGHPSTRVWTGVPGLHWPRQEVKRDRQIALHWAISRSGRWSQPRLAGRESYRGRHCQLRRCLSLTAWYWR